MKGVRSLNTGDVLAQGNAYAINLGTGVGARLTHGQHDVLLAIVHVGHRRAGLLGRHLDLPSTSSPVVLVVGAQQRNGFAGCIGVHVTFAGDHAASSSSACR